MKPHRELVGRCQIGVGAALSQKLPLDFERREPGIIGKLRLLAFPFVVRPGRRNESGHSDHSALVLRFDWFPSSGNYITTLRKPRETTYSAPS